MNQALEFIKATAAFIVNVFMIVVGNLIDSLASAWPYIKEYMVYTWQQIVQLYHFAYNFIQAQLM